MNTTSRGTIFYDAACRLCAGGARRFAPMLRARGFELCPLQSPNASRLLGVAPDRLLDEMRLLTPDGQVIGGADAMFHIARHIWWATPIWLISFIPGVRALFRSLYRRTVPYRYCIAGRCDAPTRAPRTGAAIVAWLPLILLPAGTLIFARHVAPWALMWLIAASIFLGCKWLTWRTAPAPLRANVVRSLGYLLLWPGMDASRFLEPSISVKRPTIREGSIAALKTLHGAALVWLAAVVAPAHPLLAGWVGLVGLVFLLHLGTFELLSVAWRTAGIDAEPIMHNPLRSTSVADLWGRRWNRAFRQLSDRFVFRPTRPALGAAGALLLCFLISGLIHELAITIPARGGWGGPTAYFLIQGFALLVQRSSLARRTALDRSFGGRIFTAIVAIAPLPLLFPSVFIERVILPFMQFIGGTNLPHLPALQSLILIGGALHFAILLASALVPRVLDWKSELSKLAPLLRHLIWVHGIYIVLVIVAFGSISILTARDLGSGTILARSICAFIAIFWLIRLILQFALFDARPYLKTIPLKLGYHGLTIVFSVLVLIYGLAAIAPGTMT